MLSWCVHFYFQSWSSIFVPSMIHTYNPSPVVTLYLYEDHCSTGLGSSTVDQVLKYIKYPKYIPSTSTGQVLIFIKKYLSTSSTFISSTSTSTSTVLILKLVTLYYNGAISQKIVWSNDSNHIVKFFFHWSLISTPLFM